MTDAEAREGRKVRIRPGALANLSRNDAAARMARLYAALDHAHGFYEGNSRTLREFTRELAEAPGFALDWTKARSRNELYIARDVAVLDLAFPGLTEQRAMETNDRTEYEAFFTLERLRAAMATGISNGSCGMRYSASNPEDKP